MKMNTTNLTAAQTTAEKIAQEVFEFTLAKRKSDSLDFHEVSVWSLEDALTRAYLAGLAAAENPPDEAGW